ncbi:hypothetical protein [Undibacterium sp. Xuan67W]|uniref:hypothetical protein n=1 Tax=Undibacterium sp. Xuan67W TaxID=3413057 RepID=UPI003BF54C0D
MQLIASVTDQLEYQNTANVNVANELVNQWFCDFYHPTDSQFLNEFSESEQKVLFEFNCFFDCRVSALPDTLNEMLISPIWQEVVLRSKAVLDELKWQGLDVRYEC